MGRAAHVVSIDIRVDIHRDKRPSGCRDNDSSRVLKASCCNIDLAVARA